MDTNQNNKLEKKEVRKFTEDTMRVLKGDPQAELDEEEFEENFQKLD